MITLERLRQKARGTMLGSGRGRCPGAPFEGMSTVADDALDRWLSDPSDLHYTDDTHMSIGVAQSLLARKGFDGEDMARTFAKNYFLEPWRGYGAGPPRIFSEIIAGARWDEAAKALFGGLGSHGNGAAMRVAPVAIFAARKPALVRDRRILPDFDRCGECPAEPSVRGRLTWFRGVEP